MRRAGLVREKELAAAFVDLSDTLISDYDVAELLYRLVEHCARLLDVAEAGLLLSDQRGGLQYMASTDERARLLELYQLQVDEGPCLECYHSGQPVAVSDLDECLERWPSFASAAIAEGYHAVHAFPMRLRQDTIGALNLFSTEPGALGDSDVHIAQALADVATIGILQERAVQHRETVVEQLEGALNSRIVIEQAKGVLAERGGLDMDEAFRRLRGYARGTSSRLALVAHGIATGELDPSLVLAGRPPAQSRPGPA